MGRIGGSVTVSWLRRCKISADNSPPNPWSVFERNSTRNRCEEGTAKKGQLRRDSEEGTAKKGQRRRDSEEGAAKKGQALKNHC